MKGCEDFLKFSVFEHRATIAVEWHERRARILLSFHSLQKRKNLETYYFYAMLEGSAQHL